MIVTKFAHSCLLVQDQGKSILIDPGNYSFGTGLAKDLPALDYVLVTHQHADHLHLPFLRDILEHSPNATIISNQSVAKVLATEGISVTSSGNEFINLFNTKHEELPWGHAAPDNVGFSLFNRLTHPGDSLSFTEAKDVLALPIAAPWGSFKQAFDLSLKLKPKVIIPIHDWHLRDDIRTSFYYDRSAEYYSAQGIKFVKIEDGKPIEL